MTRATATPRSTRRTSRHTNGATPADLPTDGREARTARTRVAIVDAWIELIEAGDVEPTARAVAAQAGIGLRTVFQHFEDLQALLAAGAMRHLERMAPLDTRIEATGSKDDRVHALVTKRAKWFEQVTPLRMAIAAKEASAPGLGSLMRAAEDRFASETARVFEKELNKSDKAGRTELAAALDAASCFSTWHHMRTRRNMSVATAKKVMTRQLHALL
jgi:TetR/AcrR family transcriptional regulator, regulator of autoinduction and epiphytic fitness